MSVDTERTQVAAPPSGMGRPMRHMRRIRQMTVVQMIAPGCLAGEVRLNCEPFAMPPACFCDQVQVRHEIERIGLAAHLPGLDPLPSHVRLWQATICPEFRYRSPNVSQSPSLWPWMLRVVQQT